MSLYRFIASDFLLKEVDFSGFTKLTAKEIKKKNPLPHGPFSVNELEDETEVLYVKNELDAHGLKIHACDSPPSDLEMYVNKNHVYWLEGKMNEKWYIQIVEYMIENCRITVPVELWSIWFGEGLQEIVIREIGLSEICSIDFEMLARGNCCFRIT